MPVSINMPQRREEEDGLDKLAKALNIAKTGFGIAADMKAIEEAKKEKEATAKLRDLQTKSLENEQAGILTGEKRATLLKDVIPAKEGEKGAFMLRSMGADGNVLSEWVRQAPKEVKPIDPEVAEMRAMRLEEMKRKAAEAEGAKDTIYGKARTADDAKKLKEASELKSKLDREISELITLRKEFGGEAINRDVVARAKQLSNSLLLTKKNLESLGVLSQSDRDIVDEIIPSDPTEYSFSKLLGNDPILTKLEKFKSDTESDFQARLKNRILPGNDKTPPSNEDLAALEWAQKNPNDPRAQAIMQMHSGVAKK